jgi:hypothetical protein
MDDGLHLNVLRNLGAVRQPIKGGKKWGKVWSAVAVFGPSGAVQGERARGNEPFGLELAAARAFAFGRFANGLF